jgi:hypothetical protein
VTLLTTSKGDPTTTLGRLQNVFWEQFSFSFADSYDLNAKYRAFEALAALNTYLAGGGWNLLFGNGFGKMVDLGTLMTLGLPGKQTDFQYIPILHNGYLYLLVKTGLVGFLLYASFLVWTFKAFFQARVQPALRYWPQVGLSIVLGTALGTMVMTGPFNKGDFFTTFLVLGMALRCSTARGARAGSASPGPEGPPAQAMPRPQGTRPKTARHQEEA